MTFRTELLLFNQSISTLHFWGGDASSEEEEKKTDRYLFAFFLIRE